MLHRPEIESLYSLREANVIYARGITSEVNYLCAMINNIAVSP